MRIARWLGALVVCGCSTSSFAPAPAVDAGAVGDALACPTSGAGRVVVTVSGLDAGVAAKVTLVGPSGSRSIPASAAILAPGGAYTWTAEVVTVAHPIVRRAFLPRLGGGAFCVKDGETQSLEVPYVEPPSSGKLWATSTSNGDARLVAFDAGALALPGQRSAAAVLSAQASAGRAIGFDREGNAWSLNPAQTAPTILRFAARDLAPASRTVRPDREIALPTTCAAGFDSLALDRGVAMFLSSACAHAVTMVHQQQLTASAAIAPFYTLKSIDDPHGVAFDGAGNLWVADSTSGRILRYDATHVYAFTGDPPDLVLTVRPARGGAVAPGALAFDARGSLWALGVEGTSLVEIGAPDLSGSGARDVVPVVRVDLGAGTPGGAIAFDESGGLWFGYGAGTLARLSPDQLASPGAIPTPDAIVASADLGAIGGLAFFPAPAASPLLARIP